jgi:hypothetical protein
MNENAAMGTKKVKLTDSQPTVLRLPADMREALMRYADEHDRSLSNEITIRLRVSLAAHGTTLQGILAREAFPAAGIAPAPQTTQHPVPSYLPNDKSPANALTDIDRAMLAVFRAMPPEKQLALLSLFKQP